MFVWSIEAIRLAVNSTKISVNFMNFLPIKYYDIKRAMRKQKEVWKKTYSV